MSRSEVIATREFVDNFELVASHYRLKELGEYDLAKQTARGDMDNAERSFAVMAAEIRGEKRMAD